MNGYELSRRFFDYSFENPEKVKPVHVSIYFFAIEHCNRLGWKEKFGFPSQMAMEAVGIKNWRTYIKAFNELVEMGFIEVIERSKNQYSSNIIAIVKNTEATTKALDKALQKHSTKQSRSTVSINKQLNNKQYNNGVINKNNIELISMEVDFLKENHDYDASEDLGFLTSINNKLRKKRKETGRSITDEDIFNAFCFFIDHIPDWYEYFSIKSFDSNFESIQKSIKEKLSIPEPSAPKIQKV